MRTVLLLLMLLAPGAVMAQSEVCNSSFTANVVTLSTFTGTLVDSSAIRMADRKFAEIQNISTNTVTCKDSAAVTAGQGRLLAASGGDWALSISDKGYTVTYSTTTRDYSRTEFYMGLYCIAAGDGGSKVNLTQCK